MSEAATERRRHAPIAMGAALLCVVWLFVAAWGASQYRQASHRGPVLYAPLSVAVDPGDGTIYAASGAGRVNKYDPKGVGRGAFAVDTGGASFRLSPAGPGEIELASVNGDRVLTFDEGGRIVGERVDADAYARFAAEEQARGAAPGAVLLQDDGALVRRTADGVQMLVPPLPFPLSFFAAAPWTLVLSLFLSTLGLMASFVWPFLARSPEPGVR